MTEPIKFSCGIVAALANPPPRKMRPSFSALLFADQYKKLRFRSAILAYLLVLILGSIPGAREQVAVLSSGLVLHAVTYSVITFFLFSGSTGNTWHKALQALLIVVVMGAIDEGIQTFLPYRTGSVIDWSVDVGAAFITALALGIFWPKQT